MYAVIETGGKQYRVQPGDVVQVEKLEGDLGSSLHFDQVLFLSQANPEQAEVVIGKPYVQGAKVQAEVVGQGRGDKILIIKMKRRKQYRRTQGHRQEYTQLMVTGIENGSGGRQVLSDDEKKLKLSKFRTQLKPKGTAFSAKSRVSKRKPVAEQTKQKA